MSPIASWLLLGALFWALWICVKALDGATGRVIERHLTRALPEETTMTYDLYLSIPGVEDGDPRLPAWADHDDDSTHADCEAGWFGDEDPCEGRMWVSSVEADIPLRFCDKHLRANATVITREQFLALCQENGFSS